MLEKVKKKKEIVTKVTSLLILVISMRPWIIFYLNPSPALLQMYLQTTGEHNEHISYAHILTQVCE